jgi:uncharacterized membrane protein YoaK (UPF0700 family)
VAGVLLFPFAEDTEASWAWTIAPPATAGFLGAAYWAALVLIGWSAAQESWARARATLVPVTVIAVLLLVATLVHLDRFDMDSLAGPFWLVTYCLLPLLLAALLWRQLREPGDDGPPGAPLPAGLRVLLGVQAVVMLGVGVTLFAAPDAADELWPWTLTPLTARAIGAFVTGFGVSALHAAIEDDRWRFRGAALAYLALGLLELLAAAVFADDFGDSDARTTIYLVFLVSVAAAGVWGASATRPSASRATAGSS